MFYDVSQCFTMFNNILWCWASRATIGGRRSPQGSRQRLRDRDNDTGIGNNSAGIGDNSAGIGGNSAGIGDNSAEIADDTAGIVNITANVIPC